MMPWWVGGWVGGGVGWGSGADLAKCFVNMLCVWVVLCCVSLINAFFRFVKGLEPQDRHLKMYCYYYYYYYLYCWLDIRIT